MRLVCNATTPKELREEIVSLLLHRAAQQRGLMTVTKTLAMRNMQEYAATVLGNLAGEVKCMEINDKWPSGLTESAVEDEEPNDATLAIVKSVLADRRYKANR